MIKHLVKFIILVVLLIALGYLFESIFHLNIHNLLFSMFSINADDLIIYSSLSSIVSLLITLTTIKVPLPKIQFLSYYIFKTKLLNIVLNYQNDIGNRNSWSVKESNVIKGKEMRDEDIPGYGVALINAELCKNYYPSKLNKRVNKSIQWGFDTLNIYNDSLEFFKFYYNSPTDDEQICEFDIRHTIAFGIFILNFSNIKLEHLDTWQEFLTKTHTSDGGFPSKFVINEGYSNDLEPFKSEYVSTAYCLEFLFLCLKKRLFPERNNEIRKRIHSGFKFLMKSDNYLWSTNSISNKRDSYKLSTSWVLYRLTKLKELNEENWNDFFIKSVSELLKLEFDLTNDIVLNNKLTTGFLLEIRRIGTLVEVDKYFSDNQGLHWQCKNKIIKLREKLKEIYKLKIDIDLSTSAYLLTILNYKV